MNRNSVIAALSVLALLVAVSACKGKDEGAAERAGKSIDSAMENTGNNMGEAVDAAKQKVDEAAAAAKKKMDEMAGDDHAADQ